MWQIDYLVLWLRLVFGLLTVGYESACTASIVVAGNIADKLCHPRSDAYSAEQVLLPHCFFKKFAGDDRVDHVIWVDCIPIFLQDGVM